MLIGSDRHNLLLAMPLSARENTGKQLWAGLNIKKASGVCSDQSCIGCDVA
jgi:hypothetical protein